MDSYIYGFALQHSNPAMNIPAEAQRRHQAVTQPDPAAADAYPYLIEVVTELSKTGYDQDKEFEFGLDLILDGIERLRQRI